MENFPSAAEATVWLLEPTNAMDTLDRGEPVSLSTTTPDKLPVVGVEGQTVRAQCTQCQSGEIPVAIPAAVSLLRTAPRHPPRAAGLLRHWFAGKAPLTLPRFPKCCHIHRHFYSLAASAEHWPAMSLHQTADANSPLQAPPTKFKTLGCSVSADELGRPKPPLEYRCPSKKQAQIPLQKCSLQHSGPIVHRPYPTHSAGVKR